MAKHSYPRHIKFESVFNFRDLGGYRTRGGQTVAWRRLFRSGELHYMTDRDITRLKEEIRLRSVIDLRNFRELEQFGIGPLNKVDVKHYNIPLITLSDSDRDRERVLFQDVSHMGHEYLYRIANAEFGRRVVEALEIIADSDNHPLVFHCTAGKDRTGIFTAIILGILGVTDEDVIEDYTLSDLYMKEGISRWSNDPITAEALKNVPEYRFKASPESMALFLSTLKHEHGSVKGYAEAHGVDESLIYRLEKALLA
ncbi:MAG: tyrosine-protein phosphatase [Dehalococcoidales bacterium]|nr:MAG: tyrosine-protein phosphatase [Dehalococcoidales bacterium]